MTVTGAFELERLAILMAITTRFSRIGNVIELQTTYTLAFDGDKCLARSSRFRPLVTFLTDVI